MHQIMHERYKCIQCDQYHPVEYDLIVRKQMAQTAKDLTDQNRMMTMMGPVNFNPTQVINQYSDCKARKKSGRHFEARVRAVDRQLDEDVSFLLMMESGAGSDGQFATMRKFQFEFYRLTCKAIGLDQKICLTKLKDRSGFFAGLSDMKYLSNEAQQGAALLENFHRQIKYFTANPDSQWIEITDLCTMSSINPIWFSGHRVYQFPVECDSLWTPGSLFHHHFPTLRCKIKINNHEKALLNFNIQLPDHQRVWRGYPKV